MPGLGAGTPRPRSVAACAGLCLLAHALPLAEPRRISGRLVTSSMAKPACAGPLWASLGASHGSACPGANPGPVARAPTPAGLESEKAMLLPAQN